ncbi:hypothetical protein DL770_002298 [Monosporascus sp. CRB-9-2]|nr:hypothetical protein DL770_002298 [Monosporascus sp. CRB-9-2]
MCLTTTDRSCSRITFPFENFKTLSNTLPYSALPLPVLDNLRGRKYSPQPPHLSRVLFIPKHNSAATHLPIYEITDAYTRAVRGTALGSNLYKVNLMYMDRPRGDGTDADVRFFVDVNGDKTSINVEERSMTSKEGAITTITLPREQNEHSVLTRSSLDTSYIQAVSNSDPAFRADERTAVDTKFRNYPTLTVKSADNAEIQWKVQPNDDGGLCYHLLEKRSDVAYESTDFQLKAIYHHAGAHLCHPLDYSEGVLLLPGVQDSKNDATIIALVIVLLWHATMSVDIELRVLTASHHHDIAALHHQESRADDTSPQDGTYPWESEGAAGSEPVQRWNESATVLFRVLSTFWSFFLMGANDAAYGAILPSLGSYYDLTFMVVSMVFLSPFAGYITSAVSTDYLHQTIGQRGIAVLGSSCHIIAYVIISSHPPYLVLILAFVLAGFGNGIADSAWNAWIGSLANASELLGFMHACYGVGGVVSPSLVALITNKANLEWFWFYRVMIAFATVEAVMLTWSFWKANGEVYRLTHNVARMSRQAGLMDALFSDSARVSWICAFFLLGYVGVEVSLGGFIVVFMMQVRNGDAFASGMTATGFWLGITVGRVLLGFVTPRIGVKFAVTVRSPDRASAAGGQTPFTDTGQIYIIATMGLELLFWLVPQFYVSATAVALQGFFLGPLFPAIVTVVNKLTPKHLHIAVIGFASALGACGAALIPFNIGILAQIASVMVLQPVVLAVLGGMLVIWTLLPKIDKKKV